MHVELRSHQYILKVKKISLDQLQLAAAARRQRATLHTGSKIKALDIMKESEYCIRVQADENSAWSEVV